MNEGFVFAFWLGSIVFFILYLRQGVKQYHEAFKKPFRFFQHLPFELHQAFLSPNRVTSVWRWWLFLSLMSLFAYWESIFVYPSIPLTYVLLAMMVIFIITMLSLFIMEIKKVEMYVLLVSLNLGAAVAILFLGSYLTLTSPFARWQTFLPWTTLAQGILQLMLVLNPQLKDWAKLEKVGESNEKPLYQRPTYFVLAVTQWLTMFNVGVWILLTQIELFIG